VAEASIHRLQGTRAGTEGHLPE